MQGISIYKRSNRSHWFVAYNCPKTGRRINESSGIRLDDPRGKLAAYAYAREKSASGVAMGHHRDESRWDVWVVPWLRMRFAYQQKTLTRYLGNWKFLQAFLHERKIRTPRALTYQHALDFVKWRESQKRRSGKLVSRNTALLNCKVMSRIMREAVRRGFATGNPWFRLSEDIPSAPVKKKPELTDEDIAKIRAELARRASIGRPSDWMPIAFEIALHQWCRLSATEIPMERIDLVNDTITFHEKGGKIFTVPIHPGLRPLLVRLQEEGRTVTCQLPRFASRNFSRVLRDIGLPHSFHSTRVTGITRMARAGVPEAQARAAVHHGSWAVHEIYQRLNAADIRGVHSAVQFSPAPAPAPALPQNPGAHQATPLPSPESNSGPQKSALPSPDLRATG